MKPKTQALIDTYLKSSKAKKQNKFSKNQIDTIRKVQSRNSNIA